MAMLECNFTEIGTEIIVEVRNRKLKAQIVKKPFYTKKYKKD